MGRSWWTSAAELVVRGAVARRGLFTVLCSPSQLCSCAMCSQFCAGTMLTQRLYPPPLIQPPPHPLSSNSSPHISSRRSGPTRHHIFHWEFSTPTNVQFPPKEVLDITALLEHCLQEFGSILKKSKFVSFKNVCLAQNLFIPCTVAVGVYFLCVMCSAH